MRQAASGPSPVATEPCWIYLFELAPESGGLIGLVVAGPPFAVRKPPDRRSGATRNHPARPLECAGRAQRRRRFGCRRTAVLTQSSGVARAPNPKRRGASLPAALQKRQVQGVCASAEGASCREPIRQFTFGCRSIACPRYAAPNSSDDSLSARTILPVTPPFPSNSCACLASARGNRCAMSGLILFC